MPPDITPLTSIGASERFVAGTVAAPIAAITTCASSGANRPRKHTIPSSSTHHSKHRLAWRSSAASSSRHPVRRYPFTIFSSIAAVACNA